MITFDDASNGNKTELNLKWSYIPDNSYKVLMVGGSGSGKTNTLLNLINYKPDIDKIYIYAKGLCEAKYQFLINIREELGLKHCNDLKAYI